MKYLVVYEKSPTSWGAYVPDLPGLGVAGDTLDEVKELIREAIEFHLEGMRQHGDAIPAPSASNRNVLSCGARRRNCVAVLAHAFKVEFNCFADQLLHFVEG